MNRWNIDIMDVQMSSAVRSSLASDRSLRDRLQKELDRLLPIEFDGCVNPGPADCAVKDVDGHMFAYIP